MNVWTVVATGPSMTPETARYAAARSRVAVVSDAFRLLPDAEILVSHDRNWWDKNPDALGFAGRRFSRQHVQGCERFTPPWMELGVNSGLLTMFVLRELFKPDLILLTGFDMQGSHYFGPHKEGLKNTTSRRFLQHMAQFRKWSGPEVVNCTPGSALKIFPAARLEDMI